MLETKQMQQAKNWLIKSTGFFDALEELKKIEDFKKMKELHDLQIANKSFALKLVENFYNSAFPNKTVKFKNNTFCLVVSNAYIELNNQNSKWCLFDIVNELKSYIKNALHIDDVNFLDCITPKTTATYEKETTTCGVVEFNLSSLKNSDKNANIKKLKDGFAKVGFEVVEE